MNRLEYVKAQINHKIERAKYYDETLDKNALIEFLTDLDDELYIYGIVDSIEEAHNEYCHEDCFTGDEKEDLESERDMLEDKVSELEEKVKELEAMLEKKPSKRKDNRSP